MSVFKDYFFNVLRWPLIHRPGPLAALVEGVARVLDEVRSDIIWLRNQFNPWTCDESMIIAHAQSRGVNRHPNESFQQYKDRCIRAFAWHRLGGGQLGMQKILSHHGYGGAELINVRTEDENRWAEFKPRIPVGKGLEKEDYALVAWIASETKPARSVMAGVQTSSTVSGGAEVGSVVVTSVISRITPDWPTEAKVEADVEIGGFIHTVVRSTV